MLARAVENHGLASVMIPAFNAARTIAETLESVARQTYRPLELVVINDGSTDQTDRIIQEWIATRRDSGITITYRSQPNQGLLRCRQLGVDLSTGSYLQFLDADDLLHCQKLSRCVNALTSGDYDVAVARTETFDFGHCVQRRLSGDPKTRPWTAADLRRMTITDGLWYSAGPVFTRKIVESVGKFADDVHPVAEELYFHGRIKLITRRICFLDEVLNFYRVANADSLIGSLHRVYEGRIAGQAIALGLLKQHGVTSTREWASLYRMSLRTFYQTVSCSEDAQLRDSAWRGLHETAWAWNAPVGILTGLMPRWLANGLLRGIYRLRSGGPSRSAHGRSKAST
jgi:glycosyltransferase involved in cell wall biosynthesis